MSNIVSPLIACPQIQDDLNLNFTQCNPTGAMEIQGFTDFVVSPTNTNGIYQKKISAGSGKYRDVELLFTPPVLESAVSSVAVKACTSANEAGQESYTCPIDIEVGSSYGEKFSLTHMAGMCKDNALWFAERLQAMMDVMTKHIGTKNAQQLALLYGGFATGDSGISNDIKTVTTKKTGSDDYSLDLLEEVAFSAMNNGYCTSPFIFGYGEAYKYFQRLKASCCAQEGVDYGTYLQQNNMVFVPDKKVNAALTGTDFITLAAGAVQFISWLEFEGANGINVIDDQAYKQTVITNPKNGMRFDLQIKNDCGVIHVNLKLAHKLCALPTDLYSVGDAFEGVNFINRFRITNS